jgi:competence protein ComEC
MALFCFQKICQITVALLNHIDFLDVGQGDCTILSFSDRSVVIIDTGPKRSPLIQHLRGISGEVRALILTHTHADHAGAVCSLVEDHESRIRAVYMLPDKPKGDTAFEKMFRRLQEGERRNYYKIDWAVKGINVWTSSDQSTRLDIVHPGLSGFYDAKNQNDSSAIIVLKHEDELLAVWPGDCSLEAIIDSDSIQTWLLVGPHHGAPVAKGNSLIPTQVATIAPKRSFISVGTRGRYDHPNPIYLRALSGSGCRVVCSQVTHHCDRQQAESEVPVFEGAGALGLPANPHGTSCRGAWRAIFSNGTLVPDSFEAIHLNRVSRLAKPLCLVGAGWKKRDEFQG